LQGEKSPQHNTRQRTIYTLRKKHLLTYYILTDLFLHYTITTANTKKTKSTDNDTYNYAVPNIVLRLCKC